MTGPYARMCAETWRRLTATHPGCDSCGEPPGWPCRCVNYAKGIRVTKRAGRMVEHRDEAGGAQTPDRPLTPNLYDFNQPDRGL